MPELPEVEVYLNQFKEHGLDKKIDHIEVLDDKILSNTSEKELNKLLNNHKFTDGKRIGKYLCLALDNHQCLEVHFGMTGHFEYLSNGEMPKSTRALIHFQNGEKIAYVDRRKIGHLGVAEGFEHLINAHNLGPDALIISFDELSAKTSRTKTKIKSALMDQSIVSGIGNVYADEILYQARIHPESVSSALSESHLKKIYKNFQEVLNTAIEYIQGNEGYEKARKSLPDNYLIPFRKEGNDCPSGCGGKIESIKVGGRSTYFCPECQMLISK